MAASYLYIVGVDGSPPSRRAVDFAARHAAHSGGRLLLANIIHWSGYTPLSVEEAMTRPRDKKEEERQATEEVLEPLSQIAREQGIEAETFHTWGHPADRLKKLAHERGAELIVVGRRGHSNLAEIILGSVSNSIAHISDIPVLIVP